ncbi:MAG: hypothetical protein HY706_21185 [Candidatus Hydrogenedentes bacterium]|nr:hypothetical protein [Candidatus Hydrogenedentota bacterium]
MDAALRLAAAKLRKQAIEVEVRNEPVEETIAKLLEDPLADNFASSHSTYLHRVLDEPRVRKLLDIARNGSDAERQWLAEEVREKLSSALDQMPPFIPEGEPFQPTLTSPGGALGLSLVLAETESSPSSLDLIVEMHRRGQAATKDHIRTQRGEDFQKVLLEHPYVMSRYGMVLAYSSDQILSRWAEGNVPGLELTQDQAQMLVEYSANRIKWTDSSQGYYTYQSDILEFAERIAGSTISNGDIPK